MQYELEFFRDLRNLCTPDDIIAMRSECVVLGDVIKSMQASLREKDAELLRCNEARECELAQIINFASVMRNDITLLNKKIQLLKKINSKVTLMNKFEITFDN